MSRNRSQSPRSAHKQPPQVPPYKRFASSTIAALASALVALLACCAALLLQRVHVHPTVNSNSDGLFVGNSWNSNGSKEPLCDAEMYGGWNLTWEVFDRATKHPNATVLSWLSPRLVLIRDFLSPAEIEHVVKLAEGSFERSKVTSDQGNVQEYRTSDGTWLMDERRDAKVVEIEHRMHDLVGIPHLFGEALHVLRYRRGQQFKIHPDYCAEDPSEACRLFLETGGGPTCGPGAGGVTCGDRLATFIVYLKSPDKGGATVLPWATNYRVPPEAAVGGRGYATTAAARNLPEGPPMQGAEGPEGAGVGAAEEAGDDEYATEEEDGPPDAHAPSTAPAADDFSDDDAPAQQPFSGMAEVDGVEVPEYCLEDAPTLQVAPPPGSAILFWDHVPVEGVELRPGDLLKPDPFSEHVGCPVISGTKMVVTRWIRATEARPSKA